MEITISSDEYQKLSNSYNKLQVLESYGVGNWEGDDITMGQYELSHYKK